MSIKFFGQFLLERNVINAKHLLEGIRFQESRNLKFGAYAISKGYLSEDKVRRLNDEQKRNDMRIGEMAVELGMLSEEQVDELLTMQKNDHICLGEALVTRGFVTKEILDRELDAFRAEQSAYAVSEASVPAGLKQPEYVRIMADLTLKMIRRVVQIETKMGEGALVTSEPGQAYAAISITFSGGLNYEYILLVGEGAARACAASVTGGSVEGESEELILDGVREFGNIVSGNILARMAQRGKSVEITIPHAVKYNGGYKFVSGRKAVSYQIATTAGEMTLLIIEL